MYARVRPRNGPLFCQIPVLGFRELEPSTAFATRLALKVVVWAPAKVVFFDDGHAEIAGCTYSNNDEITWISRALGARELPLARPVMRGDTGRGRGFGMSLPSHLRKVNRSMTPCLVLAGKLTMRWLKEVLEQSLSASLA